MDEVVECLKGVEVAHLGDECVLGVFVCAGGAELLPAFLDSGVGGLNLFPVFGLYYQFPPPFCYSPYLLGLSVIVKPIITWTL